MSASMFGTYEWVQHRPEDWYRGAHGNNVNSVAHVPGKINLLTNQVSLVPLWHGNVSSFQGNRSARSSCVFYRDRLLPYSAFRRCVPGDENELFNARPLPYRGGIELCFLTISAQQTKQVARTLTPSQTQFTQARRN